MGLSDRDYARQPPPGGPLRGSPLDFRRFSFNTWLIIINVAVFLAGNASTRLVMQPMGEWGAAGVPLPTGPSRTGQSVLLPSARQVEQWRDESGQVEYELIRYDSIPNFVPSASQPGWFADQLYRIRDVPRPDGSGVVPVAELVRETRYMQMQWTESLGHFSTGYAFLSLQVWRFVSFQFLHADLSHLAFNMIGLYFFGPLVESFLGSRRRYAAYYLTCGIFGALMYLLLNLLGWAVHSQFQKSVPFLLINDPYMPLIGASAGVFGVLMASAYIAGDQKMYVFMVIPMKIRTGAYLLTAGAIFNLLFNGHNAGGDAAHVGGAIAGFYFIRNMHHLEDFFDFFGSGSGKRRPRRKPSAREDRRLDAILRKVSEEGMGALTSRERKYLERAGRRSEGGSG
ncbi:MAG: rhomboid family intramembrane serine protease [Phycisphaerales bacterium]|nr:rhomboid family intramembrane serine protease [Phycisphaerales bacterium]